LAFLGGGNLHLRSFGRLHHERRFIVGSTQAKSTLFSNAVGSSTLQIEQYPPNKPNFLLVVLLACAVLLVFFVLAYLFVDFEGGHIHIRHRHANPNAWLLRPANNSSARASRAIGDGFSLFSAPTEA
jgi:hypothetical protein